MLWSLVDISSGRCRNTEYPLPLPSRHRSWEVTGGICGDALMSENSSGINVFSELYLTGFTCLESKVNKGETWTAPCHRSCLPLHMNDIVVLKNKNGKHVKNKYSKKYIQYATHGFLHKQENVPHLCFLFNSFCLVDPRLVILHCCIVKVPACSRTSGRPGGRERGRPQQARSSSWVSWGQGGKHLRMKNKIWKAESLTCKHENPCLFCCSLRWFESTHVEEYLRRVSWSLGSMVDVWLCLSRQVHLQAARVARDFPTVVTSESLDHLIHFCLGRLRAWAVSPCQPRKLGRKAKQACFLTWYRNTLLLSSVQLVVEDAVQSQTSRLPSISCCRCLSAAFERA